MNKLLPYMIVTLVIVLGVLLNRGIRILVILFLIGVQHG